MEEKITASKKILAVIAYWLLTLFGGMLWGLWNIAVDKNSISGLLIDITAFAVASWAAAIAIASITKSKSPKLCGINCVLGGLFWVALCIVNIMYVGGLYVIIKELIPSVISFIYAKKYFTKES